MPYFFWTIKRSTKVWAACLVSVMILGIFYPSLVGLVLWMKHRNSSFEGRPVSLPMFWSESHSEYPVSQSWTRPHATLFSFFDSDVETSVPFNGVSEKFPITLWDSTYGKMQTTDFEKYPELREAERLGIHCGRLRHNANSDQVAIGCLSKDLKTTLAFSGSSRNLRAGLAIMNQALASK